MFIDNLSYICLTLIPESMKKTIILMFVLISATSFAQMFSVLQKREDAVLSFNYWGITDSSSEKICYKSNTNSVGETDTSGNGCLICLYFNDDDICYKQVITVFDLEADGLVYGSINYTPWFDKVNDGYLYKKQNILARREEVGGSAVYTYTEYKCQKK